MLKSCLAAAALCLAAPAAACANLTPLEQRWLTAAYPVLEYARGLKLPIDIIVQPQARPNDVPMAMGFDKNRCKLVLSLRGNPQAENVLEGVAPDAQGELIEAMAAHEIGHCWRYAQGVWHRLPAGFVEVGAETSADPGLLEVSKQMRETRREEAYADLVALAWTWHAHRADYARIYAWLDGVRHDQPVARNGHDTRAWVKLARNGVQFGTDEQPFEAALPLWREGLVKAD